MDFLQAAIGILQTLAVVAGFFYTVRAIKASNDARNVDFVINAEGQIDPLFATLMTERAETIRAVLPNLVPPAADEIMVKAYAYTYFAYRHLSRIIYMLKNQAVSLGMDEDEREMFLEDWINEVKKYDQTILRDIHRYCRETGEFNHIFIGMMDQLYFITPPGGT